MSKETLEHLNTQTLVGLTTSDGTAWHYRTALQGGEPNHYSRPVPLDDVHRRLLPPLARSPVGHAQR